MDYLLALYDQPRLIAQGDVLIVLSGFPRLAAWWLSAGALLVISWMLATGPAFRRYGWLGFAVSLVLFAIVIPDLTRERIVVSPQALVIHTGRWFDPTVIRYSLTDFVRAYEVERPSNWYRNDYFLVLETAEGLRRRQRLGELFIANREVIFSRLESLGLAVERAPPEY